MLPKRLAKLVSKRTPQEKQTSIKLIKPFRSFWHLLALGPFVSVHLSGLVRWSGKQLTRAWRATLQR